MNITLNNSLSAPVPSVIQLSEHLLSLSHCADVVSFSGTLECDYGKQVAKKVCRQSQVRMRDRKENNRV